jgi:hypothetical protein
MGINGRNFLEITDGTSNTMVLGEYLRSRGASNDQRGMPWGDQPAYGSIYTQLSPNSRSPDLIYVGWCDSQPQVNLPCINGDRPTHRRLAPASRQRQVAWVMDVRLSPRPSICHGVAAAHYHRGRRGHPKLLSGRASSCRRPSRGSPCPARRSADRSPVPALEDGELAGRGHHPLAMSPFSLISSERARAGKWLRQLAAIEPFPASGQSAARPPPPGCPVSSPPAAATVFATPTIQRRGHRTPPDSFPSPGELIGSPASSAKPGVRSGQRFP